MLDKSLNGEFEKSNRYQAAVGRACVLIDPSRKVLLDLRYFGDGPGVLAGIMWFGHLVGALQSLSV